MKYSKQREMIMEYLKSTPHCHFLCDKCGSVQDVDMPPLDELEKKAAEKLDGEIHGHQVYFYGLCEKCLKEAKNLG